MNPSKAVREKDNLKASIRLLRFFVLVIGASILYLAYRVDGAVTNQKIILEPFGLATKMEVSSDDISKEGADFYARLAVMLRANYSPGTARAGFNRLLRLYVPESYPEAFKLYYDLADRIEEANVTSVFFIDKLVVDDKKRQVTITGQNRKYKDNTLLSDAPSQFDITYRVDRGMFQLLNIAEKEKK